MPSRFTPARQLAPRPLRPHRRLPRQVQAGWIVMAGSVRIWLFVVAIARKWAAQDRWPICFWPWFWTYFLFKLPVETMYWNSSPELKSFLSTGDFQDETHSTQWIWYIHTYIYIYMYTCSVVSYGFQNKNANREPDNLGSVAQGGWVWTKQWDHFKQSPYHPFTKPLWFNGI